MPGSVFGIGSEELDKAPATDTEAAVDAHPVLEAVLGGTDVQHAIVAGAGIRAVDE